MLRLRSAIGRASRNRWFGWAVLAFLAVLLVLVAFHALDHAIEATAALGCLAVALAGSLTRVVRDIRSDVAARRQLPQRRAPPPRTALAASGALVAVSAPLRR